MPDGVKSSTSHAALTTIVDEAGEKWRDGIRRSWWIIEHGRSAGACTKLSVGSVSGMQHQRTDVGVSLDKTRCLRTMGCIYRQ
jgi:hypothetical protein